MSLFDFFLSKLKSPQSSPSRRRLQRKTILKSTQEDLQFYSWDVRVMRRPLRKSLRIEIKKNSPILVKVNLTTPNKKILHFLEQKKSWIESNLQKFSELPSQNFFEPNKNGQILLLGGFHQLAASELSKFDSKKFFTAKGRKYLPARVVEVSTRMGLAPQTVVIRYLRSRWGSCTSKGKITLNSKIMAAPEWIIESVITHELTHLKHMNHSRAFWSVVSEFSPRHKEADLWLKKHL